MKNEKLYNEEETKLLDEERIKMIEKFNKANPTCYICKNKGTRVIQKFRFNFLTEDKIPTPEETINSGKELIFNENILATCCEHHFTLITEEEEKIMETKDEF